MQYQNALLQHFCSLPRPGMPIHSSCTIRGSWQALTRVAGPWPACCIHGHQLSCLTMGLTVDTTSCASQDRSLNKAPPVQPGFLLSCPRFLPILADTCQYASAILITSLINPPHPPSHPPALPSPPPPPCTCPATRTAHQGWHPHCHHPPRHPPRTPGAALGSGDGGQGARQQPQQHVLSLASALGGGEPH
jgi:hypothetical protein